VGGGEAEVPFPPIADEFHTGLAKCRDQRPCLVGGEALGRMTEQRLVLGQFFPCGGSQLGGVGGRLIEREIVV